MNFTACNNTKETHKFYNFQYFNTHSYAVPFVERGTLIVARHSDDGGLLSPNVLRAGVAVLPIR